jgi:hypothetical protein
MLLYINMYNTIIDPVTGKFVDVESIEGTRVLNQYLHEAMYGGGGLPSIKWRQTPKTPPDTPPDHNEDIPPGKDDQPNSDPDSDASDGWIARKKNALGEKRRIWQDHRAKKSQTKQINDAVKREKEARAADEKQAGIQEQLSALETSETEGSPQTKQAKQARQKLESEKRKLQRLARKRRNTFARSVPEGITEKRFTERVEAEMELERQAALKEPPSKPKKSFLEKLAPKNPLAEPKCQKNIGLDEKKQLSEIHSGVKQISHLYKNIILNPYTHKMLPTLINIAYNVAGRITGNSGAKKEGQQIKINASEKHKYCKRLKKNYSNLNQKQINKLIKGLKKKAGQSFDEEVEGGGFIAKQNEYVDEDLNKLSKIIKNIMNIYETQTSGFTPETKNGINNFIRDTVISLGSNYTEQIGGGLSERSPHQIAAVAALTATMAPVLIPLAAAKGAAKAASAAAQGVTKAASAIKGYSATAAAAGTGQKAAGAAAAAGKKAAVAGQKAAGATAAAAKAGANVAAGAATNAAGATAAAGKKALAKFTKWKKSKGNDDSILTSLLLPAFRYAAELPPNVLNSFIKGSEQSLRVLNSCDRSIEQACTLINQIIDKYGCSYSCPIPNCGGAEVFNTWEELYKHVMEKEHFNHPGTPIWDDEKAFEKVVSKKHGCFMIAELFDNLKIDDSPDPFSEQLDGMGSFIKQKATTAADVMKRGAKSADNTFGAVTGIEVGKTIKGKMEEIKEKISGLSNPFGLDETAQEALKAALEGKTLYSIILDNSKGAHNDKLKKYFDELEKIMRVKVESIAGDASKSGPFTNLVSKLGKIIDFLSIATSSKKGDPGAKDSKDGGEDGGEDDDDDGDEDRSATNMTGGGAEPPYFTPSEIKKHGKIPGGIDEYVGMGLGELVMIRGLTGVHAVFNGRHYTVCDRQDHNHSRSDDDRRYALYDFGNWYSGGDCGWSGERKDKCPEPQQGPNRWAVTPDIYAWQDEHLKDWIEHTGFEYGLISGADVGASGRVYLITRRDDTRARGEQALVERVEEWRISALTNEESAEIKQVYDADQVDDNFKEDNAKWIEKDNTDKWLGKGKTERLPMWHPSDGAVVRPSDMHIKWDKLDKPLDRDYSNNVGRIVKVMIDPMWKDALRFQSSASEFKDAAQILYNIPEKNLTSFNMMQKTIHKFLAMLRMSPLGASFGTSFNITKYIGKFRGLLTKLTNTVQSKINKTKEENGTKAVAGRLESNGGQALAAKAEAVAEEKRAAVEALEAKAEAAKAEAAKAEAAKAEKAVVEKAEKEKKKALTMSINKYNQDFGKTLERWLFSIGVKDVSDGELLSAWIDSERSFTNPSKKDKKDVVLDIASNQPILKYVVNSLKLTNEDVAIKALTETAETRKLMIAQNEENEETNTYKSESQIKETTIDPETEKCTRRWISTPKRDEPHDGFWDSECIETNKYSDEELKARSQQRRDSHEYTKAKQQAGITEWLKHNWPDVR